MMNLPQGYSIEARNGNILLVKLIASGQWGTWEVRDSKLIDGHFFCATCPDSEQKARADYMKRIEERP